jgi:ABC-type phosphate transport system permease subunit
MKLVAIICNVVLFGFSCFIHFTQEPSIGIGYMILGLLLLLVPILNVMVIFRNQIKNGWSGLHMRSNLSDERRESNNLSSVDSVVKIGAIIFNIALLSFALWAIISQNPHSREPGVYIFALLVLLTPVLNLMTIAQSLVRKG